MWPLPQGELLARRETRGLRALRDKLGDDFTGGVLVNLGNRSYTYEDKLHVIPLETLWR
jgi:hypothetical protein